MTRALTLLIPLGLVGCGSDDNAPPSLCDD